MPTASILQSNKIICITSILFLLITSPLMTLVHYLFFSLFQFFFRPYETSVNNARYANCFFSLTKLFVSYISLMSSFRTYLLFSSVLVQTRTRHQVNKYYCQESNRSITTGESTVTLSRYRSTAEY